MFASAEQLPATTKGVVPSNERNTLPSVGSPGSRADDQRLEPRDFGTEQGDTGGTPEQRPARGERDQRQLAQLGARRGRPQQIERGEEQGGRGRGHDREEGAGQQSGGDIFVGAARRGGRAVVERDPDDRIEGEPQDRVDAEQRNQRRAVARGQRGGDARRDAVDEGDRQQQREEIGAGRPAA